MDLFVISEKRRDFSAKSPHNPLPPLLSPATPELAAAAAASRRRHAPPRTNPSVRGAPPPPPLPPRRRSAAGTPPSPRNRRRRARGPPPRPRAADAVPATQKWRRRHLATPRAEARPPRVAARPRRRCSDVGVRVAAAGAPPAPPSGDVILTSPRWAWAGIGPTVWPACLLAPFFFFTLSFFLFPCSPNSNHLKLLKF